MSNLASAELPGPLSASELAELDAYWRAANYLSVGQIYLLDNPLLREPLRAGAHQAPPARALGHDAGTQLRLRAPEPRDPRARPGRHLHRRARPRRTRPGRERLPRGHLHGGLPAHRPRRGGPAQAVPPVLLPRRHPEPRRPRDARLDPRGRRARLLRSCTPTERPSTTRTCWSAAWSATARRRPARWRPAGTRTSSSTPSRDGAVLPILHLNGYKIANPTVLARIPESELRALMEGYGYAPRFVTGSRPAGDAPADGRHAWTRSRRRSPTSSRAPARGGAPERPAWPMIVLRTPKGWTGPKMVDGLPVEGSFRAHQVPIAELQSSPSTSPSWRHWMRCYRPEELFDESGALRAELAALAPEGDRRMGANPHANGGLLLRDLELPDFRDYAVPVPRARRPARARPRACSAHFLRDVIRSNPETLPPDRPRRDGLQPPRCRLRGHQPRLGCASGWTATTTSRPTAG